MTQAEVTRGADRRRLFGSKGLAEGYARDRPYFHPEVMERIRSRLELDRPLERGLDVGCGTGLSTIALRQLAAEVLGLDSSEEMIRAAIQADGVRYQHRSAEELPAYRPAFDIATLAGSLSWIDRRRFFPRLARALAPRAWVVIYDNSFGGEMEGCASFGDWYATELSRRFPRPPRDESCLASEELGSAGFELSTDQRYSNTVDLTLDEWVAYVLTESRVASRLGSASSDGTDARSWLLRSAAPFFAGRARTLRFGGYIWYLCKSSSAD